MRIAIIGASGHGKVVADIAEKNGYDEIVFYDDDLSKTQCGKWPVVGVTQKTAVREKNIFIAVGNASIRQRLMERFESRHFPVLIHPHAVIARDAEIGKGSVIMAGAVINPGTKIGRGVIVNTCSSVDHDCVVGDYVHIAVGAHLCGTVSIGNKTWIGAGATVINNVSIYDDCMIGAGAVVIKDIKEKGIYMGIPAKSNSKPKLTGGGQLNRLRSEQKSPMLFYTCFCRRAA